MLDMRRMISLLLAMALLTLPALAGATDADSVDAEPASGESSGSIFSSILDTGKDAFQDDADSTGESGAAPTADAAPVTNSLFGSIIDSGKPIESVPLSQATPRTHSSSRPHAEWRTPCASCAHMNTTSIYTCPPTTCGLHCPTSCPSTALSPSR